MVQKIPESVRAMIHRKAEALEPDARVMLQFASIEGEEFLSNVLARLLDTQQLYVEEGLAILAEGLLHLGGENMVPYVP